MPQETETARLPNCEIRKFQVHNFRFLPPHFHPLYCATKRKRSEKPDHIHRVPDSLSLAINIIGRRNVEGIRLTFALYFLVFVAMCLSLPWIQSRYFVLAKYYALSFVTAHHHRYQQLLVITFHRSEKDTCNLVVQKNIRISLTKSYHKYIIGP